MGKLLAIAVALVFSIASCAVFAERPPQYLLDHVAKQTLKHDQKCKFHEENNVECLIFYEKKRDIVWIILFDDDGAVTRVILVNDKEHVAWCRFDVCT